MSIGQSDETREILMVHNFSVDATIYVNEQNITAIFDKSWYIECNRMKDNQIPTEMNKLRLASFLSAFFLFVRLFCTLVRIKQKMYILPLDG